MSGNIWKENREDKQRKGLIHIYCGDGKGKTTAALGLTLRAAGRGMKVVIARFLKTEDSGEVEMLRCLPGVYLFPCEKSFGFTFSMGEEEKKEAEKYYQSLFAQAVEREADLLILDEILPACQAGLVGKQEVEDFLKEHSPGLEVVLTGRKAWREILDMADYVTEMKAVKHPYACKTLARRGIEY